VNQRFTVKHRNRLRIQMVKSPVAVCVSTIR
jgi:hypothetical protein